MHAFVSFLTFFKNLYSKAIFLTNKNATSLMSITENEAIIFVLDEDFFKKDRKVNKSHKQTINPHGMAEFCLLHFRNSENCSIGVDFSYKCSTYTIKTTVIERVTSFSILSVLNEHNVHLFLSIIMNFTSIVSDRECMFYCFSLAISPDKYIFLFDLKDRDVGKIKALLLFHGGNIEVLKLGEKTNGKICSDYEKNKYKLEIDKSSQELNTSDVLDLNAFLLTEYGKFIGFRGGENSRNKMQAGHDSENMKPGLLKVQFGKLLPLKQ